MENDQVSSVAKSQVAAIVLAAGQSRRMGAFKPLLPFGKHTVIESCVNYLQEGGADPVVVVVGHRGNEIRRRLCSHSISFAVNPNPSSEMNASIAAGVRHLPEECGAALIALADYPAVPATVVSTLINEWGRGYRLVKPTWQGQGGHPILVDLSLQNELENLDPDRGLKAIFEKYASEVRRVEVGSPYVARDIDTWDDYVVLHSEIFGEGPSEPDANYSNENCQGLI